MKCLFGIYAKDSGKALADVIMLRDEPLPDGKPYEIFDPNAVWKRKVLENYEVFISESDDACYFSAYFVEFLSNRQCYSTAYASADYTYFLDSFSLCRPSERTYEVLQVFAFHYMVEFFRGGSYYLEYNFYSSFIRIGACHGQRNSLPVLIDAQYYELTGFGLARNQRSFNLDLCDRRFEGSPSYNFIHYCSSRVHS